MPLLSEHTVHTFLVLDEPIYCSLGICHQTVISLVHFWDSVEHRRRIKTEEKAKVVAGVLGMELIQSLDALVIFHQVFKKRMNKIEATWWIGYFEKMDDQTTLQK